MTFTSQVVDRLGQKLVNNYWPAPSSVKNMYNWNKLASVIQLDTTARVHYELYERACMFALKHFNMEIHTIL